MNMKKLSLIIPSFNREKLVKETINKIISSFEKVNFIDYEIFVVISGCESLKYVDKNPFVSFVCKSERLNPGIARNVGIENTNSEWVWFIDDDDEISTDNLPILLNNILNEETDLIVHSVKNKYESKDKASLIKNVCLFKEKQEVFNYVFRRDLVQNNLINFSDGVHEDIRYVTELLLRSNNINILDVKLYNKITREDSITKVLTTTRIDGYLNSIEEILRLNNSMLVELSNDIVTQCLGTILYLIDKSDNKLFLLKHLDNSFTQELRKNITKKYTEKNTNFKYATALFLSKQDNEKFIQELNECFTSYLSCGDLKNSIFLGPKEIIGCCKRFFYKGKMKGDIVLMPDSKDVNLEGILQKKKEVEDGINTETYEPCEGCPYIERYKRKTTEKINYISLENFTYCNMRCTYCSPKYYGGKEAPYDTHDIVSNLIEGDYLDDSVHIVWGGGEPTVKPKFKEITDLLLGNEKINKIRVLTNSLRFSKDLNEMLKNEKIRVVTSIDAGTQEKFKEIRGKGEILKVLENLKKYNEQISSSENLTIKYILTEDNHSSSEIDEFVRLLSEYGFHKNFIQISCNFLMEKPSDTMLYAIYELSAKLLNNGFKFVYFDDLIRDRLKITDTIADNVIEYLQTNKLMNDNILSYKSNKQVVLWGDGYQSKWIKHNTSFGRHGNVIKVISSEAELLREEKLDDTLIICPSGIQQLPDIYKQILKSSVVDKAVFAIFI